MKRALGIVLSIAVLGACSQEASSDVSATPSGSTPVTPSSSAPEDSSQGKHVPPLPSGWTESEVQFDTELGTFFATYARPEGDTRGRAALIVGGSGPGDRNGNSGQMTNLNSNLVLSRWLAEDGVATLRVDKLGAGKTGLGNLSPTEAGKVTFDDYLGANAKALEFLSEQPGVDPTRLSVVGHSEGGLFALLLAAGDGGTAGKAPDVHSIVSVQGLSIPLLDVMKRQLEGQLDETVAAGAMSADEAKKLRDQLAAAIKAVRTNKALPKDLDPTLKGIFPAAGVDYLRSADAVDARVIATKLPKDMPALFTCSDADIQVLCPEVEQTFAKAKSANPVATLVKLEGVNHILKEDSSLSPLTYNNDYPYSSQLEEAITRWAQSSPAS